MEPLTFGKFQLDPQKERKIVLIGTALSVLLALYLYERNKASGGTSVASSTALPVVNTSGTNSASQSPASVGATAPLPTVGFNFSLDNGVNTTSQGGYNNTLNSTYQNQSSGNKSGSGGFTVFGLFGGGGGGSSQSTDATASSISQGTSQNYNVSQNNAGVFQSDVTVTNADPTTLTSVENFLTNLAGTQSERAQAQADASKYALPYLTASQKG